MDTDNTNVILISVSVLLILLFLVSTAVAVFTRYLLSRPNTLYLRIKKRLPKIMVAGEEVYKEMGRGISETRRHSLSIWSVRIAAIIIALAAAFCLWWILSPHNI
jgi:uncharacterized membrane protein